MESLQGTSWDVLISGTGIQQSLLALALSRCGKQVLHIDKNDVYGGSEAALSLQEAEKWAERVTSADWTSPFSHACITRLDGEEASKLGPSRNYSLSLAPVLLYTRSNLLLVLVSSRVHRQLEFQAVGSWFVYGNGVSKELVADESATPEQPGLIRVPNGREDIFADHSLTLKAKGSLMKFIRFVASYEDKPEVWEPHRDTPFPDFLSQQFGLPSESHGPLLALSLSSATSGATTVGFALPRIARHLRSIGTFGPGFCAVTPKWGGMSEVAQVACRAGAVGGAVYVLGKGVESIKPVRAEDDDVEEVPRPELSQQDISLEVSDAIGAENFLPVDESSLEELETGIKEQSLDELLAAAGYTVASDEPSKPVEAASTVDDVLSGSSEKPKKFSVVLQGGETVQTDFIVGTSSDLPGPPPLGDETISQSSSSTHPQAATRCIFIVSTALPGLFISTAEGGVTPAGAVIAFSSGSLEGASPQAPPVHIIAHTSDTGECPQGQTVLYTSIASTGDEAHSLLDKAVEALIATQGSDGKVLWSMRYQQTSASSASQSAAQGNANVVCFPDVSLDLAFDDAVLDHVNKAWKTITGDAPGDFMQFEDRESVAQQDSDDEDA